jgi:hypothetical protein
VARKTKESPGTRLKREFLATYTANPGELLMLDHAAELADLAERLAAEIREQPVVGQGAAGQTVAHPLHADYLAVTSKFAALIDALQLPDRPAGKLSTVARAQRAAQARWARRAG